jgi:acyl-CoA synthetase (AMP-forming)/AMP-acid ligase II/acyl carrier protein
VDLLRYRAQEQPDEVAFTFLKDGEVETGRLTYEALDKRARTIAVHLQSMSSVGERVAIIYPSGLEFITAFFGCLYAGAIAVPSYPPRRNRNLSRLLTIMSDAGTSVVLASAHLLSVLENEFKETLKATSAKCLAVESVVEDLSDTWQSPEINENSLAVLQYTSGSTSLPKGVMVSHGNVLHNEQMIKEAFGHTEKTTVVGWLPFHHDMGLFGNVLQPIYLGRPSILIPPVAFLQKPLRWLQAITRYQSVTSGGPNFAYDLCLRSITPEDRESLDLSSWEVAFNGAETVRAETLDRFAAEFESCGFRRKAFYPCYGMAEATLFISGGTKLTSPAIRQVRAEALEKNKVAITTATGREKRYLKIVSCGKTWLNQRAIIVDPSTLFQCEDDQVGEIWMSGSSIARGYWNNAEETENIFLAHLSDTGEGPFLRTGDLGFLHRGELFITGRCKDLIVIHGRNHYPQDIEFTVKRSHPAFQVGVCAAFTVEVGGAEQLVVVQEVDRNYLRHIDADEAIGTIRRAVSEEHALYTYSIALVKPFSVPQTTSGKVQRGICRSAFLENNLDVISQWSAIINQLEVEQIRVDVESLLERVQRALQHNLSPEETEKVIQEWLIAHLAKYLKFRPAQIDIEQPFSEYGLDSSLALSLTAELGEWLGIELKPSLFWDFPSIESLSQHLARNRAE